MIISRLNKDGSRVRFEFVNRMMDGIHIKLVSDFGNKVEEVIIHYSNRDFGAYRDKDKNEYIIESSRTMPASKLKVGMMLFDDDGLVPYGTWMTIVRIQVSDSDPDDVLDVTLAENTGHILHLRHFGRECDVEVKE